MVEKMPELHNICNLKIPGVMVINRLQIFTVGIATNSGLGWLTAAAEIVFIIAV